MAGSGLGAIVVTGGGRGIGAATARLAAQRGYAVCVNYRRRREAAEAVVGEIVSGGGRAIAVPGDVAVEADVLRLFEACEGALGTPVGLVNNAGVLEAQARLEEMALERWQRVFATNVFGAFLCAREAVRRMSTRNGGRGGSIVNASGGEPGRVDRVKARVPLQRGGTAEEVARAIVWLLSDEASYTTGAFLDVTGGPIV